jgi:hypothetical protein
MNKVMDGYYQFPSIPQRGIVVRTMKHLSMPGKPRYFPLLA